VLKKADPELDEMREKRVWQKKGRGIGIGRGREREKRRK
jgi:hypothetical protein